MPGMTSTGDARHRFELVLLLVCLVALGGMAAVALASGAIANDNPRCHGHHVYSECFEGE